MTVTSAHFRKNLSPRTPSTLQISWGSQIAVVVPRGTTQRSNSSGGTRVDSQWTWLSMKPGTAMSPRAVDLGGAGIGLVGADDAVARDGDVAHRHLARGEVENADRLDDQVGRALAAGLVDDVGDAGFGEGVPHGFHESQINSRPWHDNGGG